eukprot:1157449-Pelagomonas_calceolata.AAC.6
MEELGLEPNATLHHFTHPTWFEELGGFMKEENVPIFVEWAQFMFHTFHQRIKLWAIFNEPTVRARKGKEQTMLTRTRPHALTKDSLTRKLMHVSPKGSYTYVRHS